MSFHKMTATERAAEMAELAEERKERARDMKESTAAFIEEAIAIGTAQAAAGVQPTIAVQRLMGWGGEEVAKRARQDVASVALPHLMRIGRRLHKIHENQCNGYADKRGNWDAATARREEAEEKRLVADVRKTFAEYGVKPYLNSDPRGNPIGMVCVQTKRHNTMGGDYRFPIAER